MENVVLPSEDPVVTVDNVSPLAGYVSTEITITGTEFGMMAEAVTVYLGETKLEIVSCEENKIVARVPEGATAGKISVDVFGQRVYTEFLFDVLGEPGITSVNPVYGFVGDEITFIGHDLGVAKSSYNILFEGTEKTAEISGTPENEKFIVKVPEKAKNGKIKLVIAGKDVSVPLTKGFTVLQHAKVTGLTSTEGYAGGNIEINGTNLSPTLLEENVELNPIKVVLSKGETKYTLKNADNEITNEKIVAKLPDDIAAGTYIVSVSTSFEDVSSVDLTYTVKAKPEFTDISANQAHVGTVIDITCSNIDGVEADNVEVMFGGTESEVVSVSGNVIKVKVPQLEAGNYNLKLTINGAEIDLGENNQFTVLETPQITSVNIEGLLNNGTTALVAAGTELAIEGKGFGTNSEGVTLKIGEQSATITSIDGTEIKFTVPDNWGEGKISITFSGIEAPVVYEAVTFRLLTNGTDITEYVLRNYKQPFSGIDKFNGQEWNTLIEWQRNNVLSNAGIGCLQYPAINGNKDNRDSNGVIALHKWGSKNIKNGKLYQITKLPAGKFKVTVSDVASGISNGYVRCVFAVFSGNTDSQIMEYGDNAEYPEISGNMLGKVKLAPDVTGEVNFNFTVSGEKMNDVIFSFISWCHETVWVTCNSIKVEYVVE